MAFAGFYALLLATAAAIAFIHLRHLGLALLVMLAPLPGTVAAFVVPMPFLGLDVLAIAPVAVVLGFASAQLLADRIASNICDGMPRRAAVAAAWTGTARTLSPLFAALMLSLASFALVPFAHAACIAALFIVASVLVSVFALIWAAALFPYGENFIARSNRQRERMEHVVDRIVGVTVPRWAFSVSGIALVCAVLSGFGWRAFAITVFVMEPQLTFAGMAGATLLIAAVLTIGDLRLLAALFLALLLEASLGLWALAGGHSSMDPLIAEMFFLVLAFAAAPAFVFAAEVRKSLHAGDGMAAALTRALLRQCPVVAFTAVVAVVLLLPMALSATGLAWPLAITAAAPFATLLVLPALATAIETLIPRRATIEARYKVK
jgi:hypothetical protein